MKKSKVENILKNKLEKIPSLYLKKIEQFYKVDNKKLKAKLDEFDKHPNESIAFGNWFELFAGYLISNSKKNFMNYVVTSENKNENFGVDIIYPFISSKVDSKILYVFQVKTGTYSVKGKAHPANTLLNKANELLEDIQNSEKTTEMLSTKWKVSSKVFDIAKQYKDDLKLEVIWLTEDGHLPSKRSTKIYEGVKVWGVFDLLLMHNLICNPLKIDEIRTLKFKISSDFGVDGKSFIIRGVTEDLDSLVTAIRVKDLVEYLADFSIDDETMYQALFKTNVRDFQGESNIFKSIQQTLLDNASDFYYLNNGITMSASKINRSKSGHVASFEVESLNIINGQQTVQAMYDLHKQGKAIDDNAYVLLRVFNKVRMNNIEKRIAIASNTQKKIQAFEILSTLPFNALLQEKLLQYGIFYSYRTGSTEYSKQFSKWDSISLKELLKYWYILKSKNVWAKNEVDPLMNALVSASLKEKTNKKQEKYAQVTKDFINANENDQVRELESVAKLIVEGKKIVKQLKVSESKDMYYYFFMEDTSLASSEEFIKYFNTKIQDDLNKNGFADNAAKYFKAKSNSEGTFNDLIKHFDETRKI